MTSPAAFFICAVAWGTFFVVSVRSKRGSLDLGPPLSLMRFVMAGLLLVGWFGGVTSLLLTEGASNRSIVFVLLLYDTSARTVLLRYGVAIGYLTAFLFLALPKAARTGKESAVEKLEEIGQYAASVLAKRKNSAPATVGEVEYARACYAIGTLLRAKRRLARAMLVTLGLGVLVLALALSATLGFFGNPAAIDASTNAARTANLNPGIWFVVIVPLLWVGEYLYFVGAAARLVEQRTGLGRLQQTACSRRYEADPDFASDVERFSSMSVEMIEAIRLREAARGRKI